MSGRPRARGAPAWFLALLVVLGSPAPASAHLVTTGMGPVYDGIGHLLVTPEDFVPVLALALFAGLRGAESCRWAMFLVPLAWLVGGIAGMTGIAGATAPSSPAAVPVAAVSFLVLGVLVASDVRVPPVAVATLASVLGLVHGFLNGAVLRDGPGARGLVGTVAMLFVLVALASALVVSLRRPWARVAVRVAGSWIAAVGLLMAGWSAR